MEAEVVTGIHLGNLLFKGSEQPYDYESNLWLFKYGTELQIQ